MPRRSFTTTFPVGARLLRNQGATYAQMLEEHDSLALGFQWIDVTYLHSDKLQTMWTVVIWTAASENF